MYHYLKLASVLIKARYRTRLDIDDTSRLHCRVGVTDVDPFMELNHASHIAYMELGRWDFSSRIGFIELMREHGWGITVGGVFIRYRRRVPFWHKFDLTTRAICHDGRWFYFLQQVERNDQICSSALIKAGAVNPSGLVPATEVLAAKGYDDWGHEMPDWVAALIEAEGKRPWPESKPGQA